MNVLGYRIQETAVHCGIERHPQFAVIIVGQGNETERLQTRGLELARRVQHFGHPMDIARSGVERDFDEVSGGKLVLQLKQAPVDGNGLQFRARPLAAFGHHRGRDRSMELYSG